MKNYLPILILFVLSSNLNAQTQPDTLRGELEEVVVVGFEGNRSLMQSPGSIAFVASETISAFNESSILYGLNTVPGVRFEERSTGSYRIGIRGSSLRSPFGVRNVKVYWNKIPFTDPQGSTALNLLDNLNIKRAEIIKGPAGSVYGAANGGVVLLESFERSPVSEVKSDLSAGDFGFLRYTGSYINTNNSGVVQFKYARQQSDGYREQSFLDRTTIETSAKLSTSENAVITLSTLYSDLEYGIPGGLNLAQFQDNPRQARAGSINQQSGIRQENLLIGFDIDRQWNDYWSGSTTLFGNLSSFDNPFLFDYKRDSRKSWGNKSRINYKNNIGSSAIKITGGSEIQMGRNVARNFENNSGQVGQLNFDDEINIESRIYFISTDIDLPKEWFLTFGLSANTLEYDINRVATNLAGDNSRRVVKDFNTEFIPRIGLAKSISDQLSVHGSISLGFSPPTIEEVRTNEGSLNLNLEAEKGTNYELGLRGSFFNGKVVYDATSFLFLLNETIVQQPSDDPTRPDTFVFINTGSTNQKGVEIALSWDILNDPREVLSRLNLQSSYTYHNFIFDEYKKSGNDFSGNKLTGVAPNTLFSSLNVDTKFGLYGNLSHTFSDEIPLTDANSVFSDSYNLLQSKVGIKQVISRRIQFEIFAGMDNILDENYSLGYDINAFGSRFFQPAPSRNFFGGIKLNYLIADLFR